MSPSGLVEFIKDEKTLSPTVVTARSLLRSNLKEVLQDLSPREQRILSLRFGLKDGATHTLEEVGREFYSNKREDQANRSKSFREN